MLYEHLHVPYPKDLRRVFKFAELPFQRTVSAWKESSTGAEDDFVYTVEKNISILEALERTKRGSAKQLASINNIFCYERYPIEFLLRQVEIGSLADKPYGIGVIGRWDYEERLVGCGVTLQILDERLPNHYLRAFEASNLAEVDRTLDRFGALYGGLGEIPLSIWSAHANDTGMRLGAGVRERFDKSKLSNARVSRFSQVFADTPTHILLGCSTGAEEGFAQALSRSPKSRVYAADADTWPMVVVPYTLPDGKDVFIPVFGSLTNKVVNPVEYFDGKKVQSPLFATATVDSKAFI